MLSLDPQINYLVFAAISARTSSSARSVLSLAQTAILKILSCGAEINDS